MDEFSAHRLRNVIPMLIQQRNAVVSGGVPLAGHLIDLAIMQVRLALHDICRSRDVPVWCGGMLESGIGRLANVHLQTLPGFTLPGDTSASARYFEEDLIDPPVVVSPQGTIRVPERPGIGHEIVWSRVSRATTHREEWRRP